MANFFMQYPPLPNATTQAFIDDSGITQTGDMMQDFHKALSQILVNVGVLADMAAAERYSQDDLWRLYIENIISADTNAEPNNPATRGKKAGQSPGHFYKEKDRGDPGKKFKTALLIDPQIEALVHFAVQEYLTFPENMYGVHFTEDGRYMYGHDTNDNVYYQYEMTTPGDITTLTYTGNSLAELDTITCQKIGIFNSGQNIWIQHASANLYFGTLSTPYDISTFVEDGNSPIGVGSFSWRGHIHPEGTRMTTWDASGGFRADYDMSTPWDPSTRVIDGSSSLPTGMTGASGATGQFYRDGTVYYHGGSSILNIVECTTPYDTSTSVVSGQIRGITDDGSNYLSALTYWGMNQKDGGLFGWQSVGNDVWRFGIPTEDGKISEWSTTAESSFANFTSSPYSGCWNSEGDYWFYHGGLSNILGRRTASTPFDASTLGAQDHSIAEPPSAPQTSGMMLDGNGRNIVIFTLSNTVKYANLGVAWDLTSVGTWNTASSLNTAGGGCITKAGHKMFTASVGAGTQALYQYDLSTRWDPSTFSLAYTLDISSIITTTGQPDAVQINGDGTRIYAVDGGADGMVHVWAMSTPYDLSTATYEGSTQFSHTMSAITSMYYDQYSDTGTLSIWDATDQDLYVHSRVGG